MELHGLLCLQTQKRHRKIKGPNGDHGLVSRWLWIEMLHFTKFVSSLQPETWEGHPPAYCSYPRKDLSFPCIPSGSLKKPEFPRFSVHLKRIYQSTQGKIKSSCSSTTQNLCFQVKSLASSICHSIPTEFTSEIFLYEWEITPAESYNTHETSLQEQQITGTGVNCGKGGWNPISALPESKYNRLMLSWGFLFFGKQGSWAKQWSAVGVLYLTRQKNPREHGEPFSTVPEDKWGNELQNNLLWPPSQKNPPPSHPVRGDCGRKERSDSQQKQKSTAKRTACICLNKEISYIFN